jgi:hypothetical protein
MDGSSARRLELLTARMVGLPVPPGPAAATSQPPRPQLPSAPLTIDLDGDEHTRDDGAAAEPMDRDALSSSSSSSSSSPATDALLPPRVSDAGPLVRLCVCMC